MPPRTNYTHHGTKHAKRLSHCNHRREAAGMMPVSTITQFEKELKTLQAKERESARLSTKQDEILAQDVVPQITIHGLHDLKA